MSRKRLNLTGQKYHRLEVTKFLGIKSKRTNWECICDCGNKIAIDSCNLRSGGTKSCGCLRIEHLLQVCKKQSGQASFNALYTDYKKSSKRRNILFLLSASEFREITSKPCYYCGKPPEQIPNQSIKRNGDYLYNGIDRLYPNVGYTIENCVPACKTCNFAKGNLDVEQFLVLVEKIYQNCPSHNG